MKVNVPLYDGELIFGKFAINSFGDRHSRTGDIVSFVAPVDFTKLKSAIKHDEVVNFCVEIPSISIFAGVCFQRLFLINVSTILSKYLDCNVEMDDGNIVVHKEFFNNLIYLKKGMVNINQRNQIGDTFLLYLGLVNKSKSVNNNETYLMNLEQPVVDKLIKDIEDSFYYLTRTLFLEAAK